MDKVALSLLDKAYCTVAALSQMISDILWALVQDIYWASIEADIVWSWCGHNLALSKHNLLEIIYVSQSSS